MHHNNYNNKKVQINKTQANEEDVNQSESV